MANFMIHFLISSLLLGALIGLLFLFKWMLRNHLTSTMQYHLWYVMTGLLSVPFLPLSAAEFPRIFSWPGRLKHIVYSQTEIWAEKTFPLDTPAASGAIQDFALSAGRNKLSLIGVILFCVWIAGILTMLLLMIRSRRRFHRLRRSALPLQNQKIHILYKSCLDEMKISADIPIYSTAFLKSPVISGLFRPRIYLPIYVISDCTTSELRYMLLHELQHFRHKDALAGCLMDLACILYWFHPLVWYALREMRSDREIACDTAVLDLLEECDYKDYGCTLLGLAEKISLAPFPFTVGISGTMRQMEKRILHIASYQKPSAKKKLKGCISFCFLIILFLGLTPLLSASAADESTYRWDTSSETISQIDLSSYFHGYHGSFVLYDLKMDAWSVYHAEGATQRVSPNSTYKIYDALFGLEEHIITPQDSFMAWDGTAYPFASWNKDQNLYSAMQASVNWYFQKIDEQLGSAAAARYIRRIGYGNQDTHSGFRPYWMQASLKISPVEQVELLTSLYQNHFGFAQEHIDTVKKSICLFSSDDKKFYGKTGTECVEGQDINGWFIGFAETGDNTYFFAANIQGTADAAGSTAAEITLSILSDMELWNYPLFFAQR